MPTLALSNLDAHPDNANAMPRELLTKLTAHIRETGVYPPLIVRPQPAAPGRYQILDGHHRAKVLRELGYSHANCDIWNVDDDRAALLLLTLNRLHGEDDPLRRGSLLARLQRTASAAELARLLPDSADDIRKLVELTTAAPRPAPPPAPQDMPHAVTFFLNAAQRRRLMDRLDDISVNRSRALVTLLNLEQEACGESHT